MTAFAESIRRWFNAGLGFFYPEFCRLCEAERAPAAAGFVGARCRSQVRFIQPPFCERCGSPFAGDITTPFECTNPRDGTALHFRALGGRRPGRRAGGDPPFQISGELWFENLLAGLFLREAVPALRGRDWKLIVPVPLHSLRQRKREYNPAKHLAAPRGRRQIPLNERLLRRVIPTATQTLLTRQQRAENMRGAFAIRPSARSLNGEKVVLVDKNFITVTTTSACAQALRAAGAGDVCVWTVARGL